MRTCRSAYEVHDDNRHQGLSGTVPESELEVAVLASGPEVGLSR